MKTIKKFEHINANSLEEAAALLRHNGGKTWVLAGGTDLLGAMRFEVLRDYPEVLVNLKTIPGLDYIKEEDGWLKVGVLTRLEDIAKNALAQEKYPALAEAAHRTASPHIREMGTIGGNICQLIRCWYFRKDDNRFDCIRKGGAMCHAVAGDNRYHSIFGSVRVCDPPCTVNCPAGNEIATYLSHIRGDNLAEAARMLLNTNPLPAITGRVCPHTCEKDCNRGELDETISIRSIECMVGDYALEHAAVLYQAPQTENGKRVAVIGSGPAGLSAAYYLRQLGYSVTVYEALEAAGGVLTYGIPPYRLSKEVVKKQVQAIQSTGVQFKYKIDVGKDITLEELRTKYEVVFLATGAWKPASLGIPDEELLTQGLDFLSQVNRGSRNIPARKVLVIGGGSVALDVATSAKRLGAEVTLACLESREEMPGLPEEIEQAVKEGIKLMPSWGPMTVLKTNGKLSGLELMQCISVYNSEHRFAPTYDKSVTQKVEAEMVILAIGQRPNLAYAEGALVMNRGLIAVNSETQAASEPKVYAGGDATMSGPLSVVAALASGRKAANSINQALGGKTALKTERAIDHLTRCNECLDKLNRVETPQRPLGQYSLDQEDVLRMLPAAARAEAERCLNCGCDGVNPSDMAAALVALDAQIITTQRTIAADDFWVADRGLKPTVMEEDEIITEIRFPQPVGGLKSHFLKFALRKSIDFPIVNCAAAVQTKNGVVKAARICLNAVYSNPYRASKAEAYILGKQIDEAVAEAAGEAVVADAVALPYNKFKIQIAKTLVKRAILACK